MLAAAAVAIAAATAAGNARAQLPVAPEPVVGQVSLLIGEARLVHRDGSTERLRQGGSVAVGDRIETTANGHVHVRFVDNAVVSVRSRRCSRRSASSSTGWTCRRGLAK